jgi:hypothetical protein
MITPTHNRNKNEVISLDILPNDNSRSFFQSENSEHLQLEPKFRAHRPLHYKIPPSYGFLYDENYLIVVISRTTIRRFALLIS